MTPFLEPTPASRKEKWLLEQMRDVMRLKHYSLRTERTYCDWVERFVRFHKLRHPREMGEAEVAEFDSLVAHSLGLSARPSMSQLPSLLHSDGSGPQRTGRCLGPKSGVKRTLVSLSIGAETGNRLIARSRASTKAGSFIGSFEPR